MNPTSFAVRRPTTLAALGFAVGPGLEERGGAVFRKALPPRPVLETGWRPSTHGRRFVELLAEVYVLGHCRLEQRHCIVDLLTTIKVDAASFLTT